jgi:citrate lyase subunit beta/citryl-CoA lyase
VSLAFRSLLFVRADDPELLAAALASDADAVVADLEDATPADAKARAREVVAETFDAPPGGPARLVRVNRLDGDLAAADLALVASLQLDGLMVPQADEESIDLAEASGLPVVAVIENARGLRSAYEIASKPFVRAFQLGAKDLALDLGLEPRADALELLYSRSKIVADGVAAGLDGIFDRVYPAGDQAALEADALFARSLGFRGKSTLAVDDLVVINRVFAR